MFKQSGNQFRSHLAFARYAPSLLGKSRNPMGLRCDRHLGMCIVHTLEQSRSRPRTSDDKHVGITHGFQYLSNHRAFDKPTNLHSPLARCVSRKSRSTSDLEPTMRESST